MSIRPFSRGAAALVGLAAIGLLAGCGYGSPSTPGYGDSGTPTASAPATPTTEDQATALSMADSSLGSILVDGTGMTLYLFTNDSPGVSACEGQCLVNWPPLLGEPTAGDGVDASLLGSFERADGATQATYNGWPLYYWKNDTAPGDVTGQNVQDVWFVLDHDGNPVKG